MFVHIHTHFVGSYSDSLMRIEEGVRRIAGLGQPAAVITDHGDLSFIVDFYYACRRHGVKPIIGCECYFVEDARRSIEEKNPYRNHLILLAKDNDGLRNLIALNNDSWLENCYYGQRGLTDWRLLEKYHEGIIASTACYWGAVSRKYVDHGMEEARAMYARYYEIFGEDLYPELGRHGIEDEEKSNEVLLKLAGIFGSKPILTNDVHYLRQEDWVIHDILIKTRHGAASNFSVDGQNFYLKSEEEMALLGFPPSCMETTLEVAEKCNVDLDRFDWGGNSGEGDRYIWAAKLGMIDARRAVTATASVFKVDVRDLLACLPPGQSIDEALDSSPEFREKAGAFTTLLDLSRGIDGLPRRAEPDPEWAFRVNGKCTVPLKVSQGVIMAQFTRETLESIGLKVEKAGSVPALLAASEKLRALGRAAELTRQKKYGEARDTLLELYNREPEDVDCIRKIANTYYSEGSYTDAINWFKSALDLKDSKSLVPEISVRIAWCCRRLEDREGALKWFRAALSARPGHPPALYGLGLSHFLDNEYREARKYLNDFLKTNPPDKKREKADKFLATIERRTGHSR
ncbi:MAG: PHP domain-containing protein [Candidatus Tritonobacter lacicola]|nr:PHP domain-containing protein [Candidatus Tritonobacter lacicola]